MSVKIQGDQLPTATQQAEAIANKLEQAHQKAQFVQNMLMGSAQWSGEAKESCTQYLQILTQFNQQLAKKMKENAEIIQELETSIGTFEDGGFVSSIKNM